MRKPLLRLLQIVFFPAAASYQGITPFPILAAAPPFVKCVVFSPPPSRNAFVQGQKQVTLAGQASLLEQAL